MSRRNEFARLQPEPESSAGLTALLFLKAREEAAGWRRVVLEAFDLLVEEMERYRPRGDHVLEHPGRVHDPGCVALVDQVENLRRDRLVVQAVALGKGAQAM